MPSKYTITLHDLYLMDIRLKSNVDDSKMYVSHNLLLLLFTKGWSTTLITKVFKRIVLSFLLWVIFEVFFGVKSELKIGLLPQNLLLNFIFYSTTFLILRWQRLPFLIHMGYFRKLTTSHQICMNFSGYWFWMVIPREVVIALSSPEPF